jgi:PAS domain S-box-containing protein
MTTRLRLLLLHGDPAVTVPLHEVLESAEFASEIAQARHREQFVAALERGGFDVIVADYFQPDLDGASALKIAAEHAPDVPFIFFSRSPGEERVADAIKLGAADYVLTTRPERLIQSIRGALDNGAQRTESRLLDAERHDRLRFIESLDRVNRAIQGTNDLEQMMNDALAAVLDVFASDRAWILHPCDPDAASWRVVRDQTRPEFPGPYPVRTELPVDPAVAAAFHAARTSNHPVAWGAPKAPPIPAALAARFGVRSQIMMALYPRGDRPYLLGLDHCARARVWTEQDHELFREIAHRLEDAKTSLLMFRSLRESERRLEDAQRIAHVGYWDRDLEQRRGVISEESCRIFGLPVDERSFALAELQERWLALVHPDDRARVEAKSAQALLGGPPYDIEYRIVRPSGEVRIVHSRGYTMRDAAGVNQRMFGVLQDVTELRIAEQERRRTEQRFRTLVEHATDALFVTNDQNTVIDVNRQACESLGYERNELIGMTVFDFDPDFDAAKMRALWVRLMAGEVVTFETHHRRKDGTRFPVEVRVRSFEEDGRRFLSLARDITDRRRAEQRLRVQHSVAQLLAEAASLEEAAPRLLQTICECLEWDIGALWLIDRDACVLRCAQYWHGADIEAAQFEAATRAMSFGPNIGLPGRVWSSHVPACIPDVVHDPTFLRATVAEQEGLHAAFAFPILLGDDVHGVIDFISREVRQPDQDLLDVMATVGNQIGQFIDRKRAEAALQLAQAELAHVTRMMMLSELTASIAHEVNQPLGAMVASAGACARWLAGNPPDMARAQRALDRIVNDGQRASEIIARIRALAKRQLPRKAPLDINQTIVDVLALTQYEIRRNEIVLETRLAEGLPRVDADRVQLQQVLLNLFLNAIQAMSPDTDHRRELTIVSSHRDRQRVEVEVQDTGPGVSAQIADKLFEPFHTTKASGLGIGLSISRSIIEAHAGQLSFNANVPHGAVFRVSLPADPIAELTRPPGPPIALLGKS